MNDRRWTPDVEAIGDRIAALPAAGARALCRYLEQVHGVKGIALPAVLPDAIVPPPPPPDWFDVRLEGFDSARKVGVIKAVRDLLGLGIKDARDTVEQTPRVLKERLPPAAAADLKARLEAVGAKVSLT